MNALEVGDHIIETTPSGRVLRSEVTAVDVEPKYRHGYHGRFVELRSAGRTPTVMREVDVLSLDWMTVERASVA